MASVTDTSYADVTFSVGTNENNPAEPYNCLDANLHMYDVIKVNYGSSSNSAYYQLWYLY